MFQFPTDQHCVTLKYHTLYLCIWADFIAHGQNAMHLLIWKSLLLVWNLCMGNISTVWDEFWLYSSNPLSGHGQKTVLFVCLFYLFVGLFLHTFLKNPLVLHSGGMHKDSLYLTSPVFLWCLTFGFLSTNESRADFTLY